MEAQRAVTRRREQVQKDAAGAVASEGQKLAADFHEAILANARLAAMSGSLPSVSVETGQGWPVTIGGVLRRQGGDGAPGIRLRPDRHHIRRVNLVGLPAQQTT